MIRQGVKDKIINVFDDVSLGTKKNKADRIELIIEEEYVLLDRKNTEQQISKLLDIISDIATLKASPVNEKPKKEFPFVKKDKKDDMPTLS